jgi:hypothetical protein
MMPEANILKSSVLSTGELLAGRANGRSSCFRLGHEEARESVDRSFRKSPDFQNQFGLREDHQSLGEVSRLLVSHRNQVIRAAFATMCADEHPLMIWASR